MTGETRNQSQRGPVRCTLSFPKPINTVSSPVRGHIHARMSSRLADFDLRCDTLVDLLRTRAAREGDRPAYIFREDGGGEETRLGLAEAPRLRRLRWLTTDGCGSPPTAQGMDVLDFLHHGSLGGPSPGAGGGNGLLVSAEEWRPPAIGPRTIAFLQYTSGSTAMPKG